MVFFPCSHSHCHDVMERFCPDANLSMSLNDHALFDLGILCEETGDHFTVQRRSYINCQLWSRFAEKRNPAFAVTGDGRCLVQDIRWSRLRNELYIGHVVLHIGDIHSASRPKTKRNKDINDDDQSSKQADILLRNGDQFQVEPLGRAEALAIAVVLTESIDFVSVG